MIRRTLTLLAIAAFFAIPAHATGGGIFGAALQNMIEPIKGILGPIAVLAFLAAVFTFIASRSPGAIAAFLCIAVLAVAGANADTIIGWTGVSAACF